MPELSNIQTYEKISGSDFEPTLERFGKVLKAIDLWNDEIKTAFEDFEWKLEEDGYVYSSIMKLGYFTSRFSSIRIRPLVMVYTNAIDESFNDNWISCNLLFESAELRNFTNGEFLPNTYEFIKSITTQMQKEFLQTGIYFTDEAQDGAEFQGIRCYDSTKLWQFDYALIPNLLDELYLKKPKTHELKKHENYFEAWNINRWKEPNR
jgi:hypothetical protein